MPLQVIAFMDHLGFLLLRSPGRAIDSVQSLAPSTELVVNVIYPRLLKRFAQSEPSIEGASGRGLIR